MQTGTVGHPARSPASEGTKKEESRERKRKMNRRGRKNTMEKRKEVSVVYVTCDGPPWLTWFSDSYFEFYYDYGYDYHQHC